MDKSKYLTTGELAKLMHVTKNTLFHYDQIGLFSPEIVLENEYRYYSVHQIPVLEAILTLKDLGMPLKEIQQFLEGRNPEKLLELFEREEKLLAERIRKLKDRRQWMADTSRKIRDCRRLEKQQVQVVKKPCRYYVLDTFEASTDVAFAEKTTELIEAYESRCKSICYEIGYIQYENDIRRGIYDHYSNVALIVGQAPRGLDCKCLPAGDYLVTAYRGHWRGIGEAYRRILDYAAQEKLNLAAEFLEVYLIDQLAVESEEDYVTELSVRIISK